MESILDPVLLSMLGGSLGGFGIHLIRYARRAATAAPPPAAPPAINPAIPDAVRQTYGEAIRAARSAAGGPAGACEGAKLSLLTQLGDKVKGSADLIGRGLGAFDHEFVLTRDGKYVLDPVARQVLQREIPLTTRAALEARGLLGAVEEGIFTREQWQQLKSLETTAPSRVKPPRLATVLRYAAPVGKVLLGVGIVLSIAHIVMAPPGQTLNVAFQEAGAWAGALALGHLGLKLGLATGNPLAAIGLALGLAIVGAILGSLAADRLVGRSDGEVARAPGGSSSFSCDCMGIDAGILTAGWRDACISREAQMAALVASAQRPREVATRLGVQAGADGTIVAGEVCYPHGPNAWPVSGGPIDPPANLPPLTSERCRPEGLTMRCD